MVFFFLYLALRADSARGTLVRQRQPLSHVQCDIHTIQDMQYKICCCYEWRRAKSMYDVSRVKAYVLSLSSYPSVVMPFKSYLVVRPLFPVGVVHDFESIF